MFCVILHLSRMTSPIWLMLIAFYLNQCVWTHTCSLNKHAKLRRCVSMSMSRVKASGCKSLGLEFEMEQVITLTLEPRKENIQTMKYNKREKYIVSGTKVQQMAQNITNLHLTRTFPKWSFQDKKKHCCHLAVVTFNIDTVLMMVVHRANNTSILQQFVVEITENRKLLQQRHILHQEGAQQRAKPSSLKLKLNNPL